jgi:CubicO group peptidase (beta-lactamase class C family)
MKGTIVELRTRAAPQAQAARTTRPSRFQRIVSTTWMAVNLALFLMALVLTVLCAAWVLLGIVLLGSGPSPTAYPVPLTLLVPLILIVLVTLTGVLGWLIHRSGLRWVRLGVLTGFGAAVVAIVAATAAVSSPDWALWLARDMAWDGSNIWDYQKYPQQPIASPPVAYQFPQNLPPPALQTIDYTVNGQPRKSGLTELLDSSKTTSFIVVKDGALVYEAYANGYSRDSVVTSYSIAKSFTSALVGKTIEEGYICGVDDPIVMYLPELRGRGLDSARIRDLLTMSAGINFSHQDEQPPLIDMLPFNDDTRATNFPELRSLALSVKAGADAPGTAFDYNDDVPLLLGLILERSTHRRVAQYLQEKIWQPLAMEYSASWSLDSVEDGFELMYSGINARAIDFAKFGQLYVDHGRWHGLQVIPEGWVAESTAPASTDERVWRRATVWKQSGGYYKYLWWGRTRPDGSYAYMARGGVYQQWITVSPVDHLVIVRFAAESADAGEPYFWPDIFQTIANRLDGIG